MSRTDSVQRPTDWHTAVTVSGQKTREKITKHIGRVPDTITRENLVTLDAYNRARDLAQDSRITARGLVNGLSAFADGFPVAISTGRKIRRKFWVWDRPSEVLVLQRISVTEK